MMTRARRLVTTAVLFAALAMSALSAGGVRAAAAEGELTGYLPVNGGTGLLLWGGGPAADLVAAARARGCNVSTVHVTDPGGGGLIRYLPTTIQTPNEQFLTAFPDGLPASTPVMVACNEPGEPRIAFRACQPAVLGS